jgi:membrane-associated phospholipid phosphatase
MVQPCRASALKSRVGSATTAPLGNVVCSCRMKETNWTRQAEHAALDFDQRAQEFFKPYAGTPAVKALHPISKLGDQPQLRAISGALILAGIFARSHRLVNAGSRMIIAHETATFAKDIVKTEVDRTRPRSATDREQKKPKKGNHTSKEMTSFPSGHSAGAIAAARAFSRDFPEYGAAAIGAATVIALLQIPRCAHYPTDVAAGLALGLAGEAASNAVWHLAGLDEPAATEA